MKKWQITLMLIGAFTLLRFSITLAQTNSAKIVFYLAGKLIAYPIIVLLFLSIICAIFKENPWFNQWSKKEGVGIRILSIVIIFSALLFYFFDYKPTYGNLLTYGSTDVSLGKVIEFNAIYKNHP